MTCANCGVALTDDNTACEVCDRCALCMPGTCHECRDLAAEDAADRAWRAGREAS